MDELCARQGLYDLLATLFAGVPDQATIALLQTETVLAALAGLVTDDAGSDRVLRELRTAPLAELQERLAVEYTMLFSAPGPAQVPPHESVYRDKLEIMTPPQPEIDYAGGVRVFERIYWGDSTVAVSAEYRAAGFDPGDEIPDSLSLELSFMAHLLERQQAFAEDGQTAEAGACVLAQGRFLNEHLLRWVPTFAERVRHSRPESLYAMAALLVEGFLAAEAAELG